MFMWIINWIINNINGILVGLFPSIIVCCVKWSITFFRTHRSNFTGTWQQEIYPKGDDNYQLPPEKIDIYNLKHIKQKNTDRLIINIKGSIVRKQPIETIPKKVRKWKILGYLDGGIMTILYQSKEGQKSRGCIFVKFIDDNEFRGFYLEEHNIDGMLIIDKTPVILRKCIDTCL